MGPCGLLPVAAIAGVIFTTRMGALVFPEGPAADRVLAGAISFALLVACAVWGLGSVHFLTGGALLGVLGVAAIGVAWRVPVTRRFALPRGLVTKENAPLVAVAVGALGIAVLAAYWLPVWQWDALGYHLPYVNFVLVARGQDGVPTGMPYVSTYPHDVETLIVALRAMLPDDRLVDLAQIPFGLIGAAAIAGIARRHRAPSSAAIAAGAAWLVVPAVFLQLPTDYVDVACAAFLLTAIRFVIAVHLDGSCSPGLARRRLIMGGIALGFYLGSKPSAPPSAALVATLLVWAGFRARQRGFVAIALGSAFTLGGVPFLVNIVRHGNPVWPVDVELGPLRLPGTTSMAHLLRSGAAAPHFVGSLPWRIVRSWTALRSLPAFDMRIGGFGPIVLFAAPIAIAGLLRRRDMMAWGALAAAVITPDPSVARYVLAFPGLVLAFAAPCLASSPRRARLSIGLVLGVLGAIELMYAWPGLTGEGPPLLSYAHMTENERAQAVGANGPPTRLLDARHRVRAGETFAFDASFDLPYLAWTRDLRYRAVWIPAMVRSSQDAKAFVGRENVRVLVAANDSAMGEWLTKNPERFTRLFQCKSAPCSVFVRR